MCTIEQRAFEARPTGCFYIYTTDDSVNPIRDAPLAISRSLISTLQVSSKMLTLGVVYTGFVRKEMLFHNAMWIVMDA
ncbi:MAG TPA: hypothetical protein VHF65_00560 [Nitrososphaera sp.]|nr:hypothetical protein [Nitrososphaera sp.]